MLALSIREPWASAIIDGHKSIEIRYWHSIPFNSDNEIPQTIAIHASRKTDNKAYDYLISLGVPLRSKEEMDAGRGAIIGRAVLYKAKEYKNEDQFLRDQGDHLNKDYLPLHERPNQKCIGFCFRYPKRLEKPVFIKGQLGFFTINEDTLRQIF